MKLHSWTSDDDGRLKNAIEECHPIFEHFKVQNKSYTELNAWDAVAGRLLPNVCVTGAACRRRWEILCKEGPRDDRWEEVVDMVERYEKELAETTFDGVAELIGSMDALFGAVSKLDAKISKLIEMWE